MPMIKMSSMTNPELKQMHENLVRNIRELLHRNQITATQLARDISTPQSTIQNILMGRTLDPRMSTIDKICNHFNISFEKIIAPNTPGAIHSSSNKVQYLQIPVISWQQATDFKNYLQEAAPSSIRNWLLCENTLSDYSFALQTRRALEPRFPTGAYLIVDPKMQPTDNHLVIVHFKDTHEVAIREFLLDGSQKLLKPINKDGSNKVLDDSVAFIGSVYQLRYTC